MADHTNIEWTDATWNPVRGCSRVSEGCRNCYAETVAARFSDPGAPFAGFAQRGRTGSKWTGRVDVIWPLIDLPIRWRRGRRIFVNSMSDLFHPDIDIEELASVYANMVAAVHLRGHTMQVLTKRPDYMRMVLSQQTFWDQVNAEAGMVVMNNTDPLNRRSDDARATLEDYGPDHPPPGIWLGTSVENKRAADERIPELRQTPAAVRFLSCEPLIEGFDLFVAPFANPAAHQIHWVIAGGESGHGARPMHPAWVRSLRDACAEHGIPFFLKQWGEWAPVSELSEEQIDGCYARRPDVSRQCKVETAVLHANGRRFADVSAPIAFAQGQSAMMMMRVGKKAAGATLDGREHREFPAC